MSGKNFLSHIGGLRGIAILLVILFHLCPAVFPNCYYGVDVFLVITGYLLFYGAHKNDGSLKDAGIFALKKAQRILPSLSIAVLLTVIVGMYFLDKTLLEATGRLGRYALFGLSNNHLNKVLSDYFDTTASQNPLIHTWYIGITLQVYLLFALGLMLFKRVSRRTMLIFLVAIAVLSLCWKYRMEVQSSLAGVGITFSGEPLSEPTHYETLPRLWEILAGGFILLLPTLKNRGVVAALVIAGLACLSSAFFLPDAEILAVLGAMLIIRYAGGSCVEFLLSNKVLMWIGAVSFSLYLVHMPVFAFYKAWIVVPPTMGEYMAMTIIAFVLGVLFWLFVEKRHFGTISWLTLWCVTMLLCVLVKKTSFISDWLAGDAETKLIQPYNDWQLAENPDLMRAFDGDKLVYWHGMFVMSDTRQPADMPKNPFFYIGSKNESPNFVMLGDSHAASMYPGFDALCRKYNRAGIYLPSIISPFWNYEVTNSELYFCNREKIQALMHWLKAHPELEYVIVIQRWYQRCRVNKLDWNKQLADTSISAHTEGLRQFLKNMQSIGKKVILVDQIPDFETNARTYGKWCIRHERNPEDKLLPFLCSVERYQSRHGEFLNMLDTVQNEGLCDVLSFDKAVDDNGFFTSYANGEILYRDDNHPATPGAIWMMEKVAEDFLPLISKE